MKRFVDRAEAGRRLAEALQHCRAERPVVLGLPRGGVPVALEVARALDAPLDVLVVRKIGAPGHAEFAVGAIAAGVTMLHDAVIDQLGISRAHLARTIQQEMLELERRNTLYRGNRPPVSVAARTVIIVDDGLATGATATAAVRAIKRQNPRRVIFATPVGAADSVAVLRTEADEVVCLEIPDDFRAVSLWYDDFSATSDAEVMECLAKAHTGTAVAGKEIAQ
ncbi:MAG TPA: phosphoribosyltransferase family protein [Gemmatimonadales bacterium]|nr:phosphoribosyltransferase family protein [Gemmatimonadales bacterium]